MLHIKALAASVLHLATQQFVRQEELIDSVTAMFAEANREDWGFSREDLSRQIRETEELERKILEAAGRPTRDRQLSLAILVAHSRKMEDPQWWDPLAERLKRRAGASSILWTGQYVAHTLPEGFHTLVNSIMWVLALCTDQDVTSAEYQQAEEHFEEVCVAGRHGCEHLGPATWVAAYELTNQLEGTEVALIEQYLDSHAD
jgi:hypothetical protein